MAETQSAPSSEERYQTRWEAEDLGRRDGENDVTWLARFRAHFIDPTTLTEAVAAARAEGVREGLERAAGICEAHAPNISDPYMPRSEAERLGVQDEVCAMLADDIRDLISAPPTTPGGRTDG
jgi:hypothetical protein